jgi:serine/threonine protein kinase
MDPAHAPVTAPATVTFHDGLGERHRIVDRARNEPVEILCLRSELTSVPSFEFSLRERVSHLSTFRHACYARVRSVERLKNPASTLALVSDVTAGVRLSEILTFAEKAQVTLDIDAALCLLRQLVPAVAMLHENAPEIAHGAIAAERIIVTPGARIIVVEHVMGSAIAELKYSSERYWKELRVAVPGGSTQARFDHRSDVTQVAVVALSLILGRPLLDDETPGRLGDVVASSWANSARGGLEPLPAGLRAWLMRALQLDPKNRFDSAVDAQEELERVLGESDYLAAPATLEAFLAEYRADRTIGDGDANDRVDCVADCRSPPLRIGRAAARDAEARRAREREGDGSCRGSDAAHRDRGEAHRHCGGTDACGPRLSAAGRGRPERRVANRPETR